VKTAASLLALSVHGAVLLAQSPVDAPRAGPQSGWASIGVGAGSPGGVAGVISGWYSRGSFVVGGQYSAVSPMWEADTRSSVALLAGARTRGSRAFLMGTFGIAAARFVADCGGSCRLHQVGPTAAALAFSGQAVANSGVLGLTLGTFGVLGPRNVSHAGLVASLAVGWFGE
jgi:hypothetical protein